ncbi:MAG: permease [Flavobacteriaceae bacterium]|jgi:predicted permease|nr:permease [Flavobacteriaceae bacterium]
MGFAIQKTLSLLFLIVIGLLLKSKLKSKDHKQAVKTLILTIALPTVIFSALMKLHVQPSLLVLPLLVILFNLIFLVLLNFTLPLYGIKKGSPEIRTYMMLFPSLAPGLSCFPFITAYLGEETLAKAALADVGNKVSVLFLSYMLAMHWFYKYNKHVKHNRKDKIKSLLLDMVNEPINLVMLGALTLLTFNVFLEDLPLFLQDSITLLGNLMTPLILLFIGIAVIFNPAQFKSIGKLLFFRSGMIFCLSALLVAVAPGMSESAILLAVVLPQSACSFWPFAHINLVEIMERKQQEATGGEITPIFNGTLATNILAFSLPFSTLVILGIFSFSHVSPVAFTDATNLLLIGVCFIGVSILPGIYNLLTVKKKSRSGVKKRILVAIRKRDV